MGFSAVRVPALLALVLTGMGFATGAHATDDDAGVPIRFDSQALLRTRAAALASSAPADTIFVGFTPGHSADNWWSIWAEHSTTGLVRRPPARGGMWDFEPPYADVRGDSLQGWWSIRQQMSSSGGLTLPDHLRPWRAIDYGNIANHGFGTSATKRTFGVIGVWHVDGGNTTVAPAGTTWTGEAPNSGGVTWAPLGGTKSAWMGLRRHGDNTHTDPITRNPFNEDVLVFDSFQASASGGSDKKLPGYGTQMDQMLYRDINVASVPAGGSITIGFKYRTTMSSSFVTSNTTRTGWFVHDPLTVITGGSNPNFIRNDPAVASAGNPPPCDSMMVYIGTPAEVSVTLSDGLTHAIYDPQRRWFGEVVRSNEGLYKEILSRGGNNPVTTASLVVPGTVLNPIRAAGAQRVRLVFRVKTNQSFDDELTGSTGYTSGGAGAAQIDDVTVDLGGGPVSLGSFEALTDIDNTTAVSALTKWKSTGKPPQPFHHVHQLTPDVGLIYEDLCGQVGSPSRVCNMQGQIVSAGDHDFFERSGHPSGASPESEPFQGVWSPTINLCATGATRNNMGLDQDDAQATEDYYVAYELYAGIFDFMNQGNAWRVSVQSYPGGTTSTGTGEHKRWGEARYTAGLLTNDNKECLSGLFGLKGNALIRTTNSSGIPDSLRIFLGTRQETYRFSIPQHDWEDGAYWDNVSLAIVDGATPSPVSVDMWQWMHDTFPFNDTEGITLTPATFDTTAALIKTGLNIAPSTGNTFRFDVPGDTTVVNAEGDNVRVDLVFRILPGPGNYVNPVLGANSQLRATPTSTTPIPLPASGTLNFWSNYMFDNGAKGTPGGHPVAASGPLMGQKIWSPNVWNSARMDTAEFNLFQLHKRGIVQPAGPGRYMTTYHETELASPHRGALGIPRNVCFVADTSLSVPTTTVLCGSGALPMGASYPPAWVSAPGTGYNGQTTTKEGTKIIPDGLLTPGAHVQYFIRREDLGAGGAVSMCPDTTRVYPQPCENSEDGHRWQQFGVLPDRWKNPTYTHPVLGTPGRGNPPVLVIDQADRRGDERAWTGVADSMCATRAEKFGAHNGWHAPGGGADVNNPASFVRAHIGQPGTSWDLFNVKAAESLNSSSGSLGSRGGPSGLSFSDPLNIQINRKSSRIGPSEEMLAKFYGILYFMTADLSTGVWGPYTNRSQDDVRIVRNFLATGDTTTPERGLFAQGEGFVTAMLNTSDDTRDFLTHFVGVEQRNTSYLVESGNNASVVDLLSTAKLDPDGMLDRWGVLNYCADRGLAVLDRTAGLAAETDDASYYEDFGSGGPYVAGVTKRHTSFNPWISLVDGFSISRVVSPGSVASTSGRRWYYQAVFHNLFAPIAPIGCVGTFAVDDAGLREYLRLANNASASRLPELRFGLAREGHVRVQLFDVAGRRVRTLADQRFPAGDHVLPWDGRDDHGARVARGVYFLRVQGESREVASRKVVLIR